MTQTRDDAMLRERALAGLRRYQDAVRPPHASSAQICCTAGAARLLHFGGRVSATSAPVVVIPSLINPPRVMDLSEDASFMRWLALQGHDAYLVDWGHPTNDDAHMDLAGHISTRLLPLLRGLEVDIPPILLGYCLGGTLAAGASACIETSALVTIATPWNFGGFPDDVRSDIARLWASAKPLCEKLGYVPMEVLQSGFWALDPARTISKYAAFADMEEGSSAMHAFLALEDWANAGPPLTYAAGHELFEALYQDDVTGSDEWTVDAVAVRPRQFAVPALSICSSTDRIVPASSAPPLTEQWTLDMGHVGMIVGSRARDQLWEPLSQWLFKHQGGC